MKAKLKIPVNSATGKETSNISNIDYKVSIDGSKFNKRDSVEDVHIEEINGERMLIVPLSEKDTYGTLIVLKGSGCDLLDSVLAIKK